jgi:hypothetical protein
MKLNQVLFQALLFGTYLSLLNLNTPELIFEEVDFCSVLILMFFDFLL